jgi:hypothetical protein
MHVAPWVDGKETTKSCNRAIKSYMSYTKPDVRFEVFRAVNIKVEVCWVAMPCNAVLEYQHLESCPVHNTAWCHNL